MKQLSEQEVSLLLQKVHQGDEQAFRTLFDSYYKYLIVIAYRYLNDSQKAKDLAQDVFLELWNRKDSLKINFELKSYLRRAIINKSINYLKREKRMDFSDPVELPETAIPAEAPLMVEANDLQKIIQQSIDRLPTRCRIIFCMSRFEDKSHKEIASLLDISTKTIENQITRALKSIRKALAQHNFTGLIVLAFYFFSLLGDQLFLIV